MFENLVFQETCSLIASDIRKNQLPGAILYSGSNASGKLTAALETARILSCKEGNKSFTCKCPSCLQQKSLTCSNLMLLGPRDCFLEISAAKKTFLNAYKNNESYLEAARYLFIRSIRKLTLRFNGILWQGNSDLNKIGSIIEFISEDLETIDINHSLPDYSSTEKICDKLEANALKLESDYLYKSIPVSQIRNLEDWARIKSEEGKKTIIIENADKMQDSVRNALLKILEEPPSDCVFILLTNNRNAIMQTILSRVRTYNFKDRNLEQQMSVITRVYHNDSFNGSINDFLLTFLPVPPDEIKKQSIEFMNNIVKRQFPDLSVLVKQCGSFNPRIEFKLFLKFIAESQRLLMYSPKGADVSALCMQLLRECWDNVTLYNQTPLAALEILYKEISVLNVKYGNIFKCEVM